MAAANKRVLEPGHTVADRYLVRRVLGQGGMGQVLEVEHVALGRCFALKVLRVERWNDELVRRFGREARALAKISSARVAQVTDFGVDPHAGPFYVMELLEGETLEDRIHRDGRLPVREALLLGAELCEAVAEVHAGGIVHRDLKPSNVGLPRSGPVGVKLLDFGLAASMDEAFLSRITQSHQILGSVPYMAPEQFNAAEPAVSMDVYAMGIVLYEALTGRLPFVAPSPAALIHQILSMPPPPLPSELVGLTAVEALIERMLAKEPQDRFGSALAAGQAMRQTAERLSQSSAGRIAPTRGVPSAPPPPSAHPPPPFEAHAVGHGLPPTLAMSGAMPMAPAYAPPYSVPAPEQSTLAVPTLGGFLPRLALIAVLGLVFAGISAGLVVVLLSSLDGRRDDRPTMQAVAPTSPPPETRSLPPEPVPPVAAREPDPVAAPAVVETDVAPAVGATEPPVVEAERPPVAERPRVRRDPIAIEPPPIQPHIRPLAPPRRGESQWNGGTIRDWN